jgi:predicted transcriptional regulator
MKGLVMESNKNEILRLYFEEKLKQVEIAEKLKISANAVSKTLKKDERFLREKDIRKQINKRNRNKKIKNYVETKRKLKKEKDDMDYMAVKARHNEASIELSAPRKLSNIAYRNWNKSAYTFNEKRNGYELRKELGRSHDVPKFIKVEI